MSNILVGGYLSGKLYLLDTDTGQFQEQLCSTSEKNSVNTAGLAIYKTFGLFHQQSLFIAMYVDKNKMFLQIGPKIFELPDANIQIKREGIAPLVRRFRVINRRKVEISLYYFYCEFIYGKFPDFDSRDFMSCIEYDARSNISIQQFIHFWTANSQGRDVWSDEFQKELKSIGAER